MCDLFSLLDLIAAILSFLDIPVALTTNQQTKQQTMSDSDDDKLPHPDSAIRLASAVQSALSSGAVIILITSAGGAFGDRKKCHQQNIIKSQPKSEKSFRTEEE